MPRRQQSFLFCIGLLFMAFAALFWMHDESEALKILRTTKLYLKEGFHDLVPAYKDSNKTTPHEDNTTIADNFGAVGGNFTNVSDKSVAKLENRTKEDGSNATTAVNGSNASNVTRKNGTLVLYLHGEMGNNLQGLANAFTLQQMAADTYGIDTNLVLRHQEHRKWKRGRDAIHKCFPKLRHLDFEGASNKAYDDISKFQQERLREIGWDPATLHLQGDEGRFLSNYKNLLETPALTNISWHSTGPVSFPFAVAGTFVRKVMVDHYYRSILRWFKFDKTCCKALPEPDESVFHLRNYVIEMPRVTKRRSFARFLELSPNKTANELFGHLNKGDKVAITTRFGGQHVQPYVSALEWRGLKVRVIEGQTGTEDFCFLLNAQKELVGTAQSTYVFWASLLGNMTRARLYHLITPGTEEMYAYNWTQPVLKERMSYPSYKSEEQDALDAQEEEEKRRRLMFRGIF